MSTVPPKFTPPVSMKLTPAEMALHLRQLYLTINQHDQAIIQVNNKITSTSTTASTGADVDVSGVTSFNAKTGDISYFPNLGEVNNQTGVTVYTVTATDDGQMVLFNDAAAIAVALDSTITTPWFTVIFNQGTGMVTLTPTTGLINGAASIPVPGSGFSIVYFDGTNWFGSSTSGVVVVPITFAPIAHEFLIGYNAATGLFSAAQPAYSDISGSPYTVVSKNAAYNAVAWNVVACDTTVAGFTVTLPLAASNANLPITAKKVSADGNTLTVARSGADLIDGATTFTTLTPNVSVTMISDGGTNWYII